MGGDEPRVTMERGAVKHRPKLSYAFYGQQLKGLIELITIKSYLNYLLKLPQYKR